MESTKKNFISWPVLAMMGFVTVIGFEDIMYNFKNQGMGVITSWVIMMILYVAPYSLMVGQLGSVFNSEGGGLSSWIRGTNNEFLGYFTAWTYWAASIPYVVDTAQSVIVGFGWAFTGDYKFQAALPNSEFTLLTFIVFVAFIFIQRHLSNSMEILSTLGGIAMFAMTVLFILMSVTGLVQSGGHMATQPMNIHTIFPTFNLKYLTTIGLLIYAINGCELIAPYVTQLKKPKTEFPKAMLTLVLMTTFLTIFGSFSLGIFFDANHLPNDLKMNGDYYAFQALGKQYGVGNLFMYIYAWTAVIYMCARLAVLLDAMTRMLISDTGSKYMPKFLRKKNSAGLPVNGYILTTVLSGFIMLLGVFLPEMNDIFNWLLNLNGIISPGVTCWVFYAFMRIRKNSSKFQSDYVFIKNDKIAYGFGLFLLVVTAIATVFSVTPQDVTAYSGTWWYELIINIVAVIILIGLGAILPLIRKREEKYGDAFDRLQWISMIALTVVAIVSMVWLGGAGHFIAIAVIACAYFLIVWLIGRRQPAMLQEQD